MQSRYLLSFRDCFALSWQRFILDQQLDNEIKFKNINHMILSPLCSRVIQKQLNSFVGLSLKLKRRMAKHTTLINTLGWILQNRGHQMDMAVYVDANQYKQLCISSNTTKL